MKSLIRKILKEEVGNVDGFQEIYLPNGFYDLLLIEGKATIELPKGLEKKLLDYISKKYNWPPDVDKKWCSDIKEKETKDNNVIIKSCNKIFEFILSTHWLQRLFREDEPVHKKGGRFEKRKIVNPGIKEGIDLFFKKRERINEYINNAVNWQPNEVKYILLSEDDYQEIITLKKEKTGNYLAKFITQIKGERFFDTPELKKTTYL
jgi:hypothetical protein